jgi:hypothetical protein
MVSLNIKLLFLLACFLCSQAFCQSARKLNKRLKAEYVLVNSEQDSLSGLFSEEKKAKNQELKRVQEETQVMYQLEDQYMYLCTAVRNQYLKLELLGIGAVGNEEQWILNSPLFYNSAALLVKRVSKPLMILEPVIEIRGKNQHSIKIQNRQLAEIIKRKRSEIARITGDLQRLRDSRSDLRQVQSDYSDLKLFYEQRTPDLLAIQIKLGVALHEAQENYAKNGPTGFSDNYKIIFPEVFPTKEFQRPYSIEFLDTLLILEDELNRRAVFPGAQDALKDYLERNLRYPQEAYDAMIEGKCYLQVLVSSTGEVSDIQALRGVSDCKACDDEALRLATHMGNWKPAVINGKAVSSFVLLPIAFEIDR